MKNTEALLSFEEVKKNRSIIVPRIAEGNPALESIINYCIDKDMPTIACCAGHNPFDKPYIAMVYNKDTRKNINAFLNLIKGINGVEIMFSTTGFTKNPFSVVIYTNMINRNKVFDIINNSLRNNLESDDLDLELQSSLNLAIDMDYKCEYATVSLLHKHFRDKYLVGIYGKHAKGNIFEEHSDKIITADYGMTYYLYRSNEKVGYVTKDLEKIIPKLKFRNGFTISMNISTNEKVDRISEFNSILEETTGSIKRF